MEYLDGARGKSVVPGHYELVAVATDQLDIPGDGLALGGGRTHPDVVV